jgi:four helix bundle protein
MAVRTYQELLVWQKAMDLVVTVYKLSAQFPKEEIYGLTSQIRRAAVSIPSNIAEGQGRGIGNEFARFLRISQGSIQEVETQALVAERLGYVDMTDLYPLLDLSAETGRLNRGLLTSLATSN